MSGGHTPAPWTVDVDGAGCYIEAIPPRDYIIASVMFGESYTPDEVEANARLIAAAPDLLEALEGLLADITEYQTINKLGGENNHWQVIARAAIAKARQP